MVPNPSAGGALPPTSVVGDTEEYRYLVDIVKKLPQYQISLHGTDADDHSSRWDTYDKKYVDIMHYNTFLFRCGFVGDPEQAQIYREFNNGRYSISISHKPYVKVWRAYANEAEKAAAFSSNITRSYQPLGISGGVPDANGIQKDVKLLNVVGVNATITDAASWRRLARYGGGDDTPGLNPTEDSAYDNVNNIVWENAKANRETIAEKEADNLYLSLPSYSSITDAAKNTKLFVEYGLYLEVKLFSSKTSSRPSVLYIEQSGIKTVFAKDKSGFVFKIDPSQAK